MKDLRILFVDSDIVSLSNTDYILTATTLEAWRNDHERVIWPLANIFEIEIKDHIAESESPSKMSHREEVK